MEARKYNSNNTFCGVLIKPGFSVLEIIRTIQPVRTIKPMNLTKLTVKDSIDRDELTRAPKIKSVAIKPNSPIFGRRKKATMSGIIIAPPATVTQPYFVMNRGSKKAVIRHKNTTAIFFITDDWKIVFELTNILAIYNWYFTFPILSISRVDWTYLHKHLGDLKR